MLEDEESVGGEDISVEDFVRNGGEVFECVRWVGKDEVEGV